jgi:hypothetical protein
VKTTKLKFLAAAAVCLLGAGTVHGNLVVNPPGNLIVNGSFEDGLTGWSVTGNPSYHYIVDDPYPDDSRSNGFVHSGNHAAQFGAENSQTYLNPIQQNQQEVIVTTPRVSYKLDFWLKDNTPGTCLFTVRWDNHQICSLDNSYFSTKKDGFGWKEYSFIETATAEHTVLVFGFQQVASFFEFDDVSVVAVPEASTWFAGAGMLLVMLGTFVRGIRRARAG